MGPCYQHELFQLELLPHRKFDPFALLITEQTSVVASPLPDLF